MAPTCTDVEQCGCNRLLDGVKKQAPTRKPRNTFSIHRLHQRSQSCVDHSAPVPEFTCSAHSVAGRHQGSIGNAEEQALLVACSNPSFRLTREESHFASLKCHSPHGGTPRPHLNSPVPQHHSENMFVLHLQVRLSG